MVFNTESIIKLNSFIISSSLVAGNNTFERYNLPLMNYVSVGFF